MGGNTDVRSKPRATETHWGIYLELILLIPKSRPVKYAASLHRLALALELT